ncbi:MAG: hypothetical protein AAF353_08175 [Pseudomonadota bacterium]
MTVLVLFSLSGCSNKAIYDNIQINQRNKCVEEPADDYFDCIDRTRKTYAEYLKEREALLKE